MDLQNFNFHGNEVRVTLIDHEPFFVGKDAASAIGYKNFNDALSKHVKDKYKRVSRIATPYGNQEMVVISEPGLYQLAGQSKLPSAEPFQDWVYEEVLPSIRKNGVYMTDNKAYDITHNPDSLGDLLLQAGRQLKQKDLVIQEMKPKALFADAVATSETTILIGDLAKILRGNGISIGQNRLFQWLRDKHYLISRKGVSYNMPTQSAMDLGLFEIKETAITHSDGHVTVNKTPKVTGKGQGYFINLFLERLPQTVNQS